MVNATVRNAQEALRSALKAERAAKLWESGYTWERVEVLQSGPYYRVNSPKGASYVVDPLLGFKCSCQSFEQDHECKHSLAIQKVDEELAFQAAYEADGGDDRYWAEAAGLL